MKKSTALRALAASAGAIIIVGTAGAAFADTIGDTDVDVKVDIAPIAEGELALSVAPGAVTLAENGTTAEWRQFTGTLPAVTVTDTREDAAPAEAFWYVVGSSSAFVGDDGQPAIPAGHLGWTPQLLSASDSGLVAEGDPVETIMDEGPDAVGLVDQEFLVSTAGSESVREEGSWTAAADLFLRTPLDVAPGSYSATLTLSLFE